ncbi:MAG: hypothetical protein HKP21_13360 [Xanthomonadales bacterium]|nr:hypothetical protein [Gammaproteobacteria bacterium]NNK05533.1 hypothetical protein [Xanthomonadales bacterium]
MLPILVLAWYLSKLEMSTGVEAALVVLGRMLGCALAHGLVLRWAVSRFLLELKLQKVKPESQAGRSVVQTAG